MKTLRSTIARRSTLVASIASTVAVCSVASAFAASGLFTGANVQNESLTGRDIRNNSLASADVMNGSLGLMDLSYDARNALAGVAGPAGPQGLPGAAGAAGPRGFSSWDDIPAGQTVVGSFYERRANATAGSQAMVINLPGRATAPLTSALVNFTPNLVSNDDDATCTGSVAAPTAPAGKVCIYPSVTTGVTPDSADGYSDLLTRNAFRIFYVTGATSISFSGTWAYTAG